MFHLSAPPSIQPRKGLDYKDLEIDSRTSSSPSSLPDYKDMMIVSIFIIIVRKVFNNKDLKIYADRCIQLDAYRKGLPLYL